MLRNVGSTFCKDLLKAVSIWVQLIIGWRDFAVGIGSPFRLCCLYVCQCISKIISAVMVCLCMVIEWVVVSCLLVEYFFCYLCLKFYVFAMSVRWSNEFNFGGYTTLQSLGPRYLFVGCFYFWLFLLLDLCFLFETRRCSCDLEGFLLLHETLFSFISCSD